MFLNNIIFGGIEDQVGVFITSFIKGFCTNLLNAPFGYCFGDSWQSNEPLFSFLYREGAKIFNPVVFTNFVFIISVGLTFWFSCLLFRKFGLVKLLSVVLALIFSLSPYVLLHSGIHPQLLQIWLIPLFFVRIFDLVFNKKYSISNAFWAGFILAFTVLMSNYLGFFLILFTIYLFISDLICCSLIKCSFFSRVFLRYYIVMFLSFMLLVFPFLFPYIKVNYFSNSVSSADVVSLSPKRTLEDFQNFSARPWYYILPPLAHPILGKVVTRPVLNWMENSWGYFLADDYFPKEHGGDFLGWFNLTLFLIAITFAIKDIVKNVKCQMSNVKTTTQNHKSFYSEDSLKLVLTLALTIGFLFLFTMPPFFTVSGHKIYTLGFVLYKFFPMFRVTARLGIVILMGVLVVDGLFLQALFLRSQSSNVKCQIHISNVKTFILFLYLIISLFEFYVPVSTFDASKVPTVYEYLSKVDKKTSFDFNGPNGKIGHYEGSLIVAEYPGGRAEDVFWITKHHKGLINPRMVLNVEYDFSSEIFTKELNTKTGLENARNLGVSYLVFHKDRGAGLEDEDFFRKFLEVEKDFGDVILFRF